MNTTANTVTEVHYSDLTKKEWRQIIIGVWWRSAILVVLSLITAIIAGGLIGIAIGIFTAIIGLPKGSGKTFNILLGGISGVIVGVGYLHYWLRWILRSKYGSLRLSIIRITI